MPTYDYRCNRCGHTFERFQAMTAEPVATCPECNGPVTRLIGGGSAIILKGSGFRATDYGRATGLPAAGRSPAAAERCRVTSGRANPEKWVWPEEHV